MPECLRRTGNKVSPWLYGGLASYMSKVNADVAHPKCCGLEVCAKISTTNCTKMMQTRKRLTWFHHDCIFCALYFCVRVLPFCASYLRCYKQKYGRHVCRQPVLCIKMIYPGKGLYSCLMVSFLVSTLNVCASDPKCRMQKHARNLSPQTLIRNKCAG